MTNLIKRKGLLSLMAVVVMIAMMSVACKNKATRPADFSVEGDIEVADQVNTSEELVPDSAINIDSRYGMLQYGSKYFESAEYQNADGTKFRYAIEFIEDYDPQFGKGILVKFTGYDKNGAKIDKTYSSSSARKSSAEKQEYAPYQFGLMESSDLIIYATGYLDFKPKGFDAHIRLALKNK
ncbi:hypothetical protein [Brachyspira sp.]|uniref:hypothetical protein n=1 Tax=Brachyspira sp. TaxID=1977261 RepID=UPI003D7D036D